MTTLVDSLLTDWSIKSDDEKRDAYSDLEKAYEGGDNTVVSDLKSLLGKDIIVEYLFDDGFDWKQFDELVSATNTEVIAIEMGIHKSTEVFKNSLTKYGGSESRPSLTTWKNTGAVSVMRIKDNYYKIDDTGIKSLFAAISLIAPSFINSVVFNTNEVSEPNDTFLTKNDAKSIKDEVIKSINGASVDDAFNSMSTALAVFTHKLLEDVRDGVSEGSYDDTRMYALDIALTILEFGVVIKGQVIGDASNVMGGSIKMNPTEDTWLVNTVPVQTVLPYTDKVVGDPSRLLLKYENSGVFSPIVDYDLSDLVFWKRVIDTRLKVTASGEDLLINIKNNLS